MTQFPRAFVLRLHHGDALPGLELPNGRVVVFDDPDGMLSSGAPSADDLRHGYPDARIEWADQAPAEPCAQHPTAPVIGGMCGACTQYGQTLPGTPTVADWTGEQQGPLVSGGDVAAETGPPPAQPCTDPRHTGPIREQLGCNGPDPATT